MVERIIISITFASTRHSPREIRHGTTTHRRKEKAIEFLEQSGRVQYRTESPGTLKPRIGLLDPRHLDPETPRTRDPKHSTIKPETGGVQSYILFFISAMCLWLLTRGARRELVKTAADLGARRSCSGALGNFRHNQLRQFRGWRR